MFDTILGIPLHPLVVHAVVVLAPVTALLLVLVAVSASMRARIGVSLPLVATATFVASIVATQSGEALWGRLGGGGELVEVHAERGTLVPYVLSAVMVLAWALWVAARRAEDDDSRGATSPRTVLRVLDVLGIVAALGITAQVVLVGHSGAEAVWGHLGG